MFYIFRKPERIELAEKLIEQQKGVVRYWRDRWEIDRNEKIGMKDSENYKMYTLQLAKLNAYDYMYSALAGTTEEFDFVAKSIEA